MSYYWINEGDYPPGTIVQPGNWGRNVLSMPEHRWLHMEVQFEAMRQVINPSLPSRLACIFITDSLDMIKILHTKRQNDQLYEVELTDDTQLIFKTDMALVHPELEQYDAHVANPRAYWSAKPGDILQWPEILTLSPLVIKRKLSF